MNDNGETRMLRDELAAALSASGDLRSPAWRAAVQAVPRELFIPSFFERIDSAAQTLWRPITPELVDRTRRMAFTYTDETWVTQLDHSITPNDADGPVPGVPTSSSTLPGLVVRMLEELTVEDDHRVLEIGTGTGYSAALMSYRLGNDFVTSVEIDPQVAERAAKGLEAAGFSPHLVTGEGLNGHPLGAPYDRVIATCSVRHLPCAWINQTRPGGSILTTMSGWLQASSSLVCLEVTGAGTAEGEFLPGTDSFMPARPHEAPALPDDVLAWIDGLDSIRRETAAGAEILDPWEGWTSRFIAQLAVPSAQLMTCAVDDGPMTAYLIDSVHGAVAALPEGSGMVQEGGDGALWTLVERAVERWREAGSPALDQFRLRVTPNAQTVYYEDPKGQLSWDLPAGPGLTNGV